MSVGEGVTAAPLSPRKFGLKTGLLYSSGGGAGCGGLGADDVCFRILFPHDSLWNSNSGLNSIPSGVPSAVSGNCGRALSAAALCDKTAGVDAAFS